MRIVNRIVESIKNFNPKNEYTYQPLAIHKDKFSAVPQPPKFFLAANIYQNEPTLPYWKSEIIKLSNYLGKENLYISVVENFSEDNSKVLLRDFKSDLDKLGIENNIELAYKEFESQRETKKDERIDTLKDVRNRALEPLFKLKREGKQFDYVIFLNDIFFVAEDIIQLINSNEGDYDVVCSLDFMDKLYDLWVLRDIKGKMLSYNFPYFKDSKDKEKLYNKKLIPVYSCWNGAIILNTNVIYKHWNYRGNTDTDLVEFRSRKFDKTITNNFLDPNQECYSSECFLIFYDLRKKLKNLGQDLKVYINPKVTVTYELLNYIRWKEIYNNPIYRYFNYKFTDTSNPNILYGVVDNFNKEYECMNNHG